LGSVDNAHNVGTPAMAQFANAAAANSVTDKGLSKVTIQIGFRLRKGTVRVELAEFEFLVNSRL
jgi:hypothetical protein